MRLVININIDRHCCDLSNAIKEQMRQVVVTVNTLIIELTKNRRKLLKFPSKVPFLKKLGLRISSVY